MNNSNKKIILLNGPPRSGKDETAKIILGEYNSLLCKQAEIIRMADPLLQCLYSMFPQITDYEKQKADVVCGNLTPRQCIISLAETFVKPNFGKDRFVNIALEKIKQSNSKCFVIPDLGFEEEINGFISQHKDTEIILVRLHRDGCDFKNDSRKYIHDSGNNIQQIDLYNNETLLELKNKISKLFTKPQKFNDNSIIHV